MLAKSFGPIAVISALFLVTILTARLSASQKAPKKDYGGIDPKVVAAWKDAGADFGWVGHNDTGHLIIEPFRSQLEALPCFVFNKPPPAGYSKLPAPNVKFGLRPPFLVADAALKELGPMIHLEVLMLSSSQVTDIDLKDLTGLSQLRWLCLAHNPITNIGLRELGGIRQLQLLDISGTRVTDIGLKELTGLKRLMALSLNGTEVTDVGMKELAELSQLQALLLSGTNVTDQGLKQLVALQKLQALFAYDTRLTNDGLSELKKAIPALQIHK